MDLSKINKTSSFINKQKCVSESKRFLNDKRFNIHKPAVSIVSLRTYEDIETYLFPRIEHFHKHKTNKKVDVTSNVFNDYESKLFQQKALNIFSFQSKQATYNTIDYIFKQFRRGIFVQILNNKIYTFIELDNQTNESDINILDHLKFDQSKFKDKEDFLSTISNELFWYYRIEKLKEDSIYFTNCTVKLWENSNINEIETDWIYITQYDYLVELLKNRKVKDCEFIINFKDQLVLFEDGKTNPHYHILGNMSTKLKKQYSSFIPILNNASHTKFADIPIPTNDDWEIISQRMMLGTCRNLYINIDHTINRNYDSKIPTAIFRGGATGCGTTIKNNPRLKVAYLSNKYRKHKKYGVGNSLDGYPFLDARIVSFKVRPKKHYSDKYISIIDPRELPFKLSKKISLGDISKYKYIISIEGNIAQFRLTYELSYNSVVLLVKSDHYIWYQPLLKPWVHYVPIKSDLSDLIEKIEWCKKNDSKCKKIALNAFNFYQSFINRDSVFDYLQLLFNR